MELKSLLREVAQLRATDLYLLAGAIPCINHDGTFLQPRSCQGQRLSPKETAQFAREIMTSQQWEDFQNTWESNLAFMCEGIGRFRVNVMRQRGSIGLVFRRVVMDIPTLRQLRLPPALRDIALDDRGIILVTGSTGSGKSTTMASMIDYRNHVRTGHIVTIEDPIEFVYQHRRSVVTQREVGVDTLTFEAALRNTLRQAPQVISIGELRDADTVAFALHAAETGHLVFATLHSTNTTLAIERILHFYPSNAHHQVIFQLSLNLKAIVCQRLVPKVGGGRVVACEILVNTPRVQDLIARNDMSAIRLALSGENNSGLQSFDKSLFQLYRMGEITQEEALQAAESSNDLQMRFRGIGVEEGSSWMDTTDPWTTVGDDFARPDGYKTAADITHSNITAYSNETAPPLPHRSRSGERPPSASPSQSPRTADPSRGPAPSQPRLTPPPPAGHRPPPAAPSRPASASPPQRTAPPPSPPPPSHLASRSDASSRPDGRPAAPGQNPSRPPSQAAPPPRHQVSPRQGAAGPDKVVEKYKDLIEKSIPPERRN